MIIWLDKSYGQIWLYRDKKLIEMSINVWQINLITSASFSHTCFKIFSKFIWKVHKGKTHIKNWIINFYLCLSVKTVYLKAFLAYDTIEF